MNARDLNAALHAESDGKTRVYSQFPDMSSSWVEEFVLNTDLTHQEFTRSHPVTQEEWIATVITGYLKSGTRLRKVTWRKA
jgi:hypothetical protein